LIKEGGEMISKAAFAEIKLIKEKLIKHKEKIDEEIKAIDTFLEIIEKEDPEESEDPEDDKPVEKISVKLTDAEKKLKKKEYMKEYWARKKKEQEIKHRGTFDEPIGTVKSGNLKGTKLA